MTINPHKMIFFFDQLYIFLLYILSNVCNSKLNRCIFLWFDKILWLHVIHKMPIIWPRKSRFSKKFLKTRQDQDFENKDLEKGKDTKLNFGNQEGNENTKMYKIKNILLFSVTSLWLNGKQLPQTESTWCKNQKSHQF